jgi:hypothetical protein
MVKFQIGDVCIGQHFAAEVDLNGLECEVREVFPCEGSYKHERIFPPTHTTLPFYRVVWQDGRENHVLEANLKKKGPALGTWDKIEHACGWNPTKARRLIIRRSRPQ